MSVERKPKDCKGNPINVGDTVVTRYLNVRKVVECEAFSGGYYIKLDNGRETYACTLLNLTALGYKQ